jgi:hypothetical protein
MREFCCTYFLFEKKKVSKEKPLPLRGRDEAADAGGLADRQ